MLIKTISIGDVHGDSTWKSIADIQELRDGRQKNPAFDKYIFVGDYTDSWSISDDDMVQNLKDIIDFKKLYPDNVILLLGNHDLFYYMDEENKHNFACSGNRPQIWDKLHSLFSKNKDLFMPIYKIGDYVWSHAGLTKRMLSALTYGDITKTINIDKEIWRRFNDLDETIFNVGVSRGGGPFIPGIFWADKIDTSFAFPNNIHQIVGHSRVNEITSVIKNTASITYIDCLDRVIEGYVLDVNIE